MLVSVFEGLGWGGVGVDPKPGPCHHLLAPEEGGRALVFFGFALDESHVSKSQNLSDPYPSFPHLLSGTPKCLSLGVLGERTA